MIKRSLFFANPYHLSVSNMQLVVRGKGENEMSTTIPIEDVGFMILEKPQITFINIPKDFENHICKLQMQWRTI